MTAHSEGPWYLSDRGESIATPRWSIDRHIPDTDPHLPQHAIEEIARVNRRVNCNLITAAPEMLTALKECQELLEDDLNNYSRLDPLRATVTAVIAKAEGR